MHAVAPLTARLPEALRARHEGAVQVLLGEKRWEGAGGLDVTGDMRLAIAGQAALLQLRAGADFYPGLHSIVIYPTAFNVAHERVDDDGLVHVEEDELSGESWGQGTVVLGWDDVRRESRKRDGYNVVLHEFAHYLDAEGRGLAPLPRSQSTTGRVRAIDAWHTDLVAEYEALCDTVDRGEPTLLDPYAAEDEIEFFAVASEEFIECPGELRTAHPSLYALMLEFYGIDPAEWSVTAFDPGFPRASGKADTLAQGKPGPNA